MYDRRDRDIILENAFAACERVREIENTPREGSDSSANLHAYNSRPTGVRSWRSPVAAKKTQREPQPQDWSDWNSWGREIARSALTEMLSETPFTELQMEAIGAALSEIRHGMNVKIASLEAKVAALENLNKLKVVNPKDKPDAAA